jgi:uncharacterized protein (DUF1778 family)
MSSSSILSVRLSDQERALLEAASSQSRTNLSDFVRRKAVEAAEVDVLERRIITIPAKDWERFEAWARKPARKIAGLKDLALRPPTWRTYRRHARSLKMTSATISIVGGTLSMRGFGATLGTIMRQAYRAQA